MSDKQITWIAISVSVLLHLVLAGFLLFGPNIESNKKPVKPVAIKAKVIDLKPQSPAKKPPIKKPPVKTPKKTVDTKALEREKQLKKQREQQKKLEQQKERLKQLEKKRQAKKLAEEKAKKEKALKEKKEKQRKEKLKKEQEKKERERKEKERKEKERKEKQRLEKEKKEKERKEKERKEKQRKAEEARKKQEQAERDALAEAMAAEEAEFQAEENERLAAEYSGTIKKKISRNWNRPPNTQNGMVVELLIELLPNGMVSSVSISKSSGDDRFDRSAVNAVNKAEQFPALADAPPEVFETYFRRFTLKFKPEDLAR